MAALLARVKKAVNGAMNLADSYTETPSDGSRAYEQQLIDMAITVELELIAIGLDNPTWSNRTDYQQSTSVAHGAALPAHTGPIDAVILGTVVAQPAPIDQIETERRLRTAGVTEITAHYNADGMFLAHNGASNATVKSCIVSRGSILQGPDWMEGAIIRGVLSMISSPEGENPEMQGEFRVQYAQDKQMIASGQIPPPFQQAQG